MLSSGQIVRMSEDQAKLSKVVGLRPVAYTFDDLRTFPPFPFPFIGSYVPDGFEAIEDESGNVVTLFADSSGFGRDDELALSVNGLVRELGKLVLRYGQPGHNVNRSLILYAGIVESGEFQVVVGLFRWVGVGEPAAPSGCPECSERGGLYVDHMGELECAGCNQDPETCDHHCPDHTIVGCRNCGAVFILDEAGLTPC